MTASTEDLIRALLGRAEQVLAGNEGTLESRLERAGHLIDDAQGMIRGVLQTSAMEGVPLD